MHATSHRDTFDTYARKHTQTHMHALRCSHSSSPQCRRPSPAALQSPPSALLQRQRGVASVRPAAQTSIEVSASLRRPPEALQPARISKRRLSCSGPDPASLLSPASCRPPPPESSCAASVAHWPSLALMHPLEVAMHILHAREYRGRRCAQCSPHPSPARRRPSPAEPRPPSSGRFQKRRRAASFRTAAQASIAVSASLHNPPAALQPAHTSERRLSRSGQAPACLLSPASRQPAAPRGRVRRRRRTRSLFCHDVSSGYIHPSICTYVCLSI
jgi:hypothetical protein